MILVSIWPYPRQMTHECRPPKKCDPFIVMETGPKKALLRSLVNKVVLRRVVANRFSVCIIWREILLFRVFNLRLWDALRKG